MAETKKEKIMRLLHCSEAEAEDIIRNDAIIDKGGRTDYDLSPEAEKAAKKYANSTTRKTTTTTRTRKENPTKATVIAEIAKFLESNTEIKAENIQVLNKERQISMQIGENMFEITLTQKRKG